MASKYPKQNLVFPILGLHEGVGYDIQPPGTTADALNVRGYDPIKQRLRGGRRPGLSKWHPVQINGSAAIQLMEKVVQAREPLLAATQPAALLADYTVAAASPDFLGDWLPTFAGGGRLINEASSLTSWAVEAGPPKAFATEFIGVPASKSVRVLLSGFRTTRDMTVTYKVKPTTVGGFSVNDSLLGIGVLFRSTLTGFNYFYGYFAEVSTDKVKFVIDRAAGSGVTEGVAESPEFDISGSTTAVDGLTIRVDWIDHREVSITIAWSDVTQQGVDAKWLGDTFTFTDDANYVGDEYAFGGPVIRAHSQGSLGERRITNIVVTFEKPGTPNVLHTLTDADNDPLLPFQYETPDGWSRWIVDGSGVVSDQADGPTSQADPVFGTINTTGELLYGTLVLHDPDATRSFIRRTATPTARQAIEVRFSNDGRGVQFMHGMAAVFAINDALNRYVVVHMQVIVNSIPGAYGIGRLPFVQITVFGSTPVMVVNQFAQNSPGLPTVYTKDGAGTWLRVTFDGSIIRISINGQEYLTYTLNPTDLTNLGYTSTTVPIRNAIGFVNGHQARIIEEETEEQSIQDQLVVVAGGTIKVIEDGALSIPTNGALALSHKPYTIQAQSAYGRVFFVDGTLMKHYRFATNAVSDWVATAGTVPAKARLIALYRGRVVVAGVRTDPHNWFMPRLGDPFDFDYSPATPSVIQAVAGNNSDAGLIGDIITALIPFGDDYMWIGGDHTIWQLTGDPAAGGTIDQVTDKTGILFGKAWTKNPQNELFFAAIDGIYRAIPNELPKNITKGRLDKRIRDIDPSAYRVYLEWDYLRWGLVVMYMALDTSVANIAFFWDARSDAWWPDEYSATYGPSSIYAFDGLAADDQAMLFGSRDGYIRKVDDTADDDDGLAITSRIRFAPLIAPDHASEVVTGAVYPVLAANSGPVDLKIYTGQTAEECVTATNPRVKRTLLRGGRNPMIRQRVRGYAIQHELSQTAARSRWALENLTVEFEQGGLPRRDAVRNTSG